METINKTTQRGISAMDKLLIALGMIIAIMIALAGLVGLIYWIAGNTLEHNPGVLRWWATILTAIYLPSIIATWRIAKNEAKAHLKGFNRGLDGAQDTLVAVGRGLSATASMARAARPVMAPMRTDDLLPPVGSMRLIASSADPDHVIDL